MRLTAFVILMLCICISLTLLGFPSYASVQQMKTIGENRSLSFTNCASYNDTNGTVVSDQFCVHTDNANANQNSVMAQFMLVLIAASVITIIAGFLTGGFSSIFIIPAVMVFGFAQFFVLPFGFIAMFDAQTAFIVQLVINVLMVLAIMNFIRGGG